MANLLGATTSAFRFSLACVECRWCVFRRNVRASVVSTRNDRGLSVSLFTVAPIPSFTFYACLQLRSWYSCSFDRSVDSCSKPLSTICGSSCFSSVGIRQRVLRLIRRSLGAHSVLSRCMLRYFNNAKRESVLSSEHLRIIFFAVCTNVSARLLVFGYRGLDVTCSKSQAAANLANS